MSCIKLFVSVWFAFVTVAFCNAQAQPLSLKNAVLMISGTIQSPMKETVQEVLREEIFKRTGLTLKTATQFPSANVPVIVLVNTADKEFAGKKNPSSNNQDNAYRPESFRVLTEPSGKNTIVWIVAPDSRGILFGAGWLLRQLKMSAKVLQLPNAIDFSSSPDYPIRGHQLGYRNTANSYDAWTVAQFDQYIRELAIFGSNAVEGIPLHEKESPSPHFKISPVEMNRNISAICQKYDMDYWVWTPATFDLKDKNKRAEELKWHEQFYKDCVRLDHIFFPGGDPGHNHPAEVLPFLKDLHHLLIKYHPKGKIWISLQGFDTEQIDYFYNYLKIENPDWLEGVVSGPSSPPIAETRYRLPEKYKHRQYPDITHTVRCEFPMPEWDQAYALTLGRESVNPRPYTFARVHQTYAPFTDGFVSYSDGNHDDVNKVIWNGLGWNQQQDLHELLREYSRFFFGANVADAAADGIEALENNWKGPIAENGGVEASFAFWKGLEMKAPVLNKENWRWQMLLLRAYYDTYTRRRLLYEEASEKKVNHILSNVTVNNWQTIIGAARAELVISDSKNVAPGIRKRIEEICADLYRTTGFQSSVPKYKAKGYERGAVLDFVDYPLNNRWWINDQLDSISKLTDHEAVVKHLGWMARWENPGTGSYYDDVSSVSKGPRVLTISDDATDIAWWDNGFSRKRLSSQTYQRCPRLEYSNLNPSARYSLKICGYGEALLRVDGVRLSPLIYNREADSFKEWIIPLSLTQDGKISVSFDQPEESHLNWRQNSRISDVWLLKH